MEKIKLGIIGCGLAAKELHLPALIKLKDKFEVTALCNHTETKAKELNELLGGGVPVYKDYKDLLKTDVDAVDIALPIELNFQVTQDSLIAGKHVLVEKPVTATLEEGKELLTFPGKYKKVIMVAENFRYREVYNKAKELIDNNRIGKVYSTIWNVFYTVTTDSKYAATKWRQNHKYPGGFMSDAGVHNIAALRMLFGDIKSINAFTASLNPSIGTPDTMSIHFNTDKIFGTYNLYFSVNGLWRNEFKIFGEEGTMIINDNKITIKITDKDDEIIDMKDDGGYYNEFVDFYNGIKNNSVVKSSVLEGYKDLEVILNALKSAEEGLRIEL